MSTHTGAVTVVRFSPCGRYLASGSDDRVVLIWELDETRVPRQEFGSAAGPAMAGPLSIGSVSEQQSSANNTEQNSETWVARKRLVGHDNDVQDLAWAPDSSILVTVGLDSSIIIWSGATFEKIKRFDIHQSHVKGVSFDPANKYFATASDDRTVKIIRYHHTSSNEVSFSVEATISAPFKGSPLSTYYRRCSWSPDGNHIAAANATNLPLATVTIINRGTWESDISLVGHDAPCEVASFCPRIFCLDQSAPVDKAQDPNDYKSLISVIATAGQDKTLAIWNTSSPRPLLVATNVAEKSITDISWSGDGLTLYASSLDGTILVAVFKPGELGWVVPIEANELQLIRYGGGKEALQIPASTGILELEEATELHEKELEKAHRAKMAEKERILDNIMGSNPSNTTSTFDKKTKEEKSKTKTEPKAKSESKVKETDTPTNPFKPLEPVQPARPKPATVTHKITITKDGKKRIAPTLISVSSTVTSRASKPASQLATPIPNATATAVAQPSAAGFVIEYAPAANILPKGGVAALLIGSKRRADTAENGADTTKEANASTEKVAPSGHGPKKQKSQYPELQFTQPPMVMPSVGVAQLRINVPKVKGTISRYGAVTAPGTAPGTDILNGSSSSSSDSKPGDSPNIIGPNDGPTSYEPTAPLTMLQIRNSAKDKDPTRVIVTRAGSVLFMDYLPRYATLAAGSCTAFWAVATEDGSIYVYSPSGRRLFPPIVIGAPLAFLESTGDILIAISVVGIVYVWDVVGSRPGPGLEEHEPRALQAPVSLAAVFDGSSTYEEEEGLVKTPNLTHAAVTPCGQPFVTLSNGSSFIYSSQMKVWTRVTETWWAEASQYWDTTTFLQPVPNSIYAGTNLVSLLEQRTTCDTILFESSRGKFLQQLTRQRLLKDGYEGFEAQVSLAHLENRMAAARVAGSQREYSAFAKMYTERVAELGFSEKLDELFGQVLGSAHADASCDERIGVKKEKDADLHNLLDFQPATKFSLSYYPSAPSHLSLLKEMLVIAAKYPKVQTVVDKYTEAVETGV